MTLTVTNCLCIKAGTRLTCKLNLPAAALKSQLRGFALSFCLIDVKPYEDSFDLPQSVFFFLDESIAEVICLTSTKG